MNINNVDVDKITISNKVFFGNWVSNTLLVTKMIKRLYIMDM